MTDRLETILALADGHPAEPMPQYMAGNELLNAGQPGRALQYLERYVGMLPGGDLGAAYRLIARAHLALGRKVATREAFETAIQSALAHGHGDLAGAIREEAEGA